MRRALALALLSGCACGDRTRDGLQCVPDVALGGIWLGDLRYTELNGLPYDWKRLTAARFEEGRDASMTMAGERYEVRLRERGYSLEARRSDEISTADYDLAYEETVRFEDPYWDGRMDGSLEALQIYEPDGLPAAEYLLLGALDLVKFQRFSATEAEGLALVGEARPSVQAFSVNVRVRDGIAAVANYQDGLRLFDVADPAAPIEVGHAAPTSGEPTEIWNDVKWLADGAQNYVLIGSSEVGLVVVDATDPAAPTQVATWPPAGDWTRYDVHTVWVDEAARIAYLGHSGREEGGEWLPGGLEIVDLSDPAAPVGLGRWGADEVGGPFVHDLFVADGLAYLCAWDAGLVIVDVTDPTAPLRVGGYDAYDRRTSHSVWVSEIAGRKIAVHGDEDFGAHLRVLDVTDPASVVLLAEWETRPEVSIHNVMLLGTTAYVAHYQDGVRILDLSDPAAPTEVAHFETWDAAAPGAGDSPYEGAVGIDVIDGLVYVADSARGLLVLEPE